MTQSLGDSHGLVSAQNPANKSNGAWVKKDPERFTKRPVQEYLDDERSPRFWQSPPRDLTFTASPHQTKGMKSKRF